MGTSKLLWGWPDKMLGGNLRWTSIPSSIQSIYEMVGCRLCVDFSFYSAVHLAFTRITICKTLSVAMETSGNQCPPLNCQIGALRRRKETVITRMSTESGLKTGHAPMESANGFDVILDWRWTLFVSGILFNCFYPSSKQTFILMLWLLSDCPPAIFWFPFNHQGW